MMDKAKQRADWLGKAGILTEALPYMRRYGGKTFVKKYGGHAMGDSKLAAEFAHDIVLLQQVGIYPVVIHGGGPQIGAMLDRLAIDSNFVGGLRVTDSATVDIVEMVLSGQLNKKIAVEINRAGGTAIGISGKDGGLLTVKKLTSIGDETGGKVPVDLGFVGEPTNINPYIVNAMRETEIIPVIAPLGCDVHGETFNVNADTAAGAAAAGVDAERLILLTDVEGVLDKEGKLIPELNVDEARTLMDDGTISGGMIPKLETCICAVQNGVEGAVMIDGRVPHGVLLEIFTEHGSGTLIRA